MLRAPVWALCCCLAMADGLLGCDTSCDKEDEDPVVHTTGITSPACTSYQSGRFDQPYLEFPKGRRLRFPHGLAQVPVLVKSYLAFEKTPLDTEHGNTAESAGNQVIIEAVNDEFVVVRNDTCEEDFWLRLVVEVDAPAPECLNPDQGASAGGAAGAAGGAGAGG